MKQQGFADACLRCDFVHGAFLIGVLGKYPVSRVDDADLLFLRQGVKFFISNIGISFLANAHCITISAIEKAPSICFKTNPQGLKIITVLQLFGNISHYITKHLNTQYRLFYPFSKTVNGLIMQIKYVKTITHMNRLKHLPNNPFTHQGDSTFMNEKCLNAFIPIYGWIPLMKLILKK